MAHYNTKELYEQYKKVVFSVVNLYLDNPSDREDVFQETWLSVYKSLGNFDHRSKISTWIYSVARHTALNYRRKMRVVTQTKPADEKKSALEDKVIAKLDLRRAIDKLTPDEQEVIFMHYSRDFSYQEMSQQLDLPLSTVKSRLFEARKKLRLFLNR